MEQKIIKKTRPKQAIVISTVMGLGHMRAAYPLKDLSLNQIDSLGSPKDISAQEYKIWQKMMRLYYFLSKSEHIPIIGKYIFHIMILFRRNFTLLSQKRFICAKLGCEVSE